MVSRSRKGVPAWATEKLVACVDGPMKGQWYTAADFQERVETSRRMVAKGQRPSPVLYYAASGTVVEHPEWPPVVDGDGNVTADGVIGAALTYQPKR